MQSGEKKLAREKKILIFVNYRQTVYAATLYEFSIPIERIITNHRSGILTDCLENILEPVKQFYKQRRLYTIDSVAACVLGNGKLCTIPDNPDYIRYCYDPDEIKHRKSLYPPEEASRLPFYCYDLSTKLLSTEAIPVSRARKSMPLVTVIGGKEKEEIFALSAYTDPDWEIPESQSRFECLETSTGVWKDLPLCPPLLQPYIVSGYAVLGNNFILVCFHHCKRYNEIIFYSYNIGSGTWKQVHTEDGVPSLDREAVALNQNIYTYHPKNRALFVFSYTVHASGGFDLSLGSATTVKGLMFKEVLEAANNILFSRSGAITKVEHQILCVVHTLCMWDEKLFDICASVIQFDDQSDCCTTLMSFHCSLLVGSDMSLPIIQSCHAVDVEETDNHHFKNQRSNPEDREGSSMEKDHGI